MTNFDKTPHFPHRIFLIRHGQTEWSKAHKHTGHSDIPLTAHGESEAEKLPSALKKIKFAKVYVSPLLRALKTCELAGLKKDAIVTKDLLEWDYGDYEGITTKEIRKTNPHWNLFKEGSPNGESVEEVSHRADHILKLATQVPGDVAFFSSGHISRVLGARWLNFPPEYAQFLTLSTASISILSYEHEWRVIQAWNSTAHLEVG